MLSSLRNFILTLFFSLVIFGVGAYFLVGFVNTFINDLGKGKTSDDGTNIAAPNVAAEGEEDDDVDGNPSKLTVLIIGLDDGLSQRNEKKEADSIYLVDINADNKILMTSSLPCDIKFTVKGYVMRLGMVMAEYDIDTMLATIKALTGITPDYYFTFEYESILKMMELFGDMSFNVPQDMYYMPELYPVPEIDEENDEVPEEREPEIDLKQGKQPIDGEKAVQLLRFKDYSNGNMGRITTQMDFIREFLRQKVTFEYLAQAKSIFDVLKDTVTTNMKEPDFLKFMNLIFSASSYEQVIEEYPGQTSLENGNLFYNPSVTRAIKQYAPYRKNAPTNAD